MVLLLSHNTNSTFMKSTDFGLEQQALCCPDLGFELSLAPADRDGLPTPLGQRGSTRRFYRFQKKTLGNVGQKGRINTVIPNASVLRGGYFVASNLESWRYSPTGTTPGFLGVFFLVADQFLSTTYFSADTLDISEVTDAIASLQHFWQAMVREAMNLWAHTMNLLLKAKAHFQVLLVVQGERPEWLYMRVVYHQMYYPI